MEALGEHATCVNATSSKTAQLKTPPFRCTSLAHIHIMVRGSNCRMVANARGFFRPSSKHGSLAQAWPAGQRKHHRAARRHPDPDARARATLQATAKKRRPTLLVHKPRCARSVTWRPSTGDCANGSLSFAILCGSVVFGWAL